MKKFILIFFISLYPIFASTLSVNLSSEAQSTLKVNGETTSFDVSVLQNEDGKLVFKPCPIFTYGKGNLKIGVLEPSKDYYGIAYTSGNFGFFFSNPIFVPTASHSAGVSFDSEKFYAKAVIDNRKTSKVSSDFDYQVDWNKVKTGLTYDLLLGTKDSFNILGINAESDFHCSLSEAQIQVSLSWQHAKLELKEALNNGRVYKIAFSCGDFLKTEWNYHIEPKNHYAGQANPSEVSLDTRLSFRQFKISSKSVIEYKRETGKFARTEIQAGYTSDIVNCNIESSYQRTRGTENGFSFPSVSVEFDNATLEVKNKKLYLTITLFRTHSKCKTEFRITQDRVYTLSMSFNN